MPSRGFYFGREIFMRVRSKIHACHEGTALPPVHGVFAVLWDNGLWSYLHRDEFVILERGEPCT
jgi:hypothetical protein